jgi:hypothetical protein
MTRNSFYQLSAMQGPVCYLLSASSYRGPPSVYSLFNCNGSAIAGFTWQDPVLQISAFKASHCRISCQNTSKTVVSCQTPALDSIICQDPARAVSDVRILPCGWYQQSGPCTCWYQQSGLYPTICGTSSQYLVIAGVSCQDLNCICCQEPTHPTIRCENSTPALVSY